MANLVVHLRSEQQRVEQLYPRALQPLREGPSRGPKLASPRRNQYIASPTAMTLTMAGSVSASVGGNAHPSHVSGNRHAVCGLEQNGAPAYAYGFQSGGRPARTSRAAQSVHG